MNAAFKPRLKLSQAKKLIKTVISEGGKLNRVGASCASLVDRRNLSTTLCFKSNLELRGLI
jgi:hypothetical protein